LVEKASQDQDANLSLPLLWLLLCCTTWNYCLAVVYYPMEMQWIKLSWVKKS